MANWIIDRTINLDYRKTVRVLQLLLEEPRKDDPTLEKQLMEEKVLKNGSEGALRRRWYTYLRNYGLLHENTVTEMGAKYAKGKLSLHELALLQMIKRKIRIPSEAYISPLKVIVLTLKKLIASHGIEAGFLTQAEFSNFVVNIENESENSLSTLASTIANNRAANVPIDIVAGEHTDIWFNNFKQIGLFEVIGKSIFVDETCLDLFYCICSIYESETATDNICRFKDKFVSNIKIPSLSVDNITARTDASTAGVLYDYLFCNLTAIKLAEKYSKGDTNAITELLASWGVIASTNKGLYKDFQAYPRIVVQRLRCENNGNIKQIADALEWFIDKTFPIEIEEEGEADNLDILNHNFFGMHITRRNSAVENGEISIGWSALGDLSSVDTKEALSALFDATFPDKKPRSKAQDISQVWSFINGMAIDDYVVFSDGANAHIGVIRSDYFFEMNRDVRDEDYVNNRKVEWLKSIPRDKLPKVFRSALAATRSVFSLNNYKSIILELLEKDSLDYDDDDNDILVEADELEPEYTIDQLGAILRDMYDCCDSKVTGVHMFGLKYGAVIKKYGYAATSIVDSSGIGKSYHIEVSKGIGIYESILNDDFGVRFFTENDEGKEDNMEEQRPFIDLNFATNVDCDFDRNRIVFGAPGTGKSFQLEEDKDKIVQMGGGYERVTFHPDYTYSSFVGCYKPVSKHGKIEYEYVPGPFMRVLVEALRSGINDEKAKPYLLLIEEINRAKVAAVFGEVFQLLDRDNSGKSDYEIHASEDVKKYLADELNGSLESFARIKIPNNMFIWASMNSADQGVFPMDTAFKRRWSFEYKGIDENEDKVGGTIVLGKNDYAFEINWNTLRKAINTTLATKFGINEDKLMGPFFIGEDVFAFGEDGKIINPEKFIKVFKSKVIMYLYEDAAKQQKHKLFSGCDSSRYSSICDAFDEIGIEIFGADFKNTYDEIKEAEVSR